MLSNCMVEVVPSQDEWNDLKVVSVPNKVDTVCPSPPEEWLLVGRSPPITRFTEHLTELRT